MPTPADDAPTTWRPRDSRGHYLATRDVHTMLEPDAWDDTCRHTPAAAPEPSSETFGHEPVVMDIGSCGMGGCQCPGHDDAEVCARCVIVEYETRTELVTDGHGNDQPVHDRWVVRRDPVLWPCTSAIVLGLEPRPVARAVNAATHTTTA